jgi:hypothetical protein
VLAQFLDAFAQMRGRGGFTALLANERQDVLFELEQVLARRTVVQMALDDLLFVMIQFAVKVGIEAVERLTAVVHLPPLP